MRESDGGSGIDIYLVRHAESCSNIQRDDSRTNDNTYRIKNNGVLHEPSLSIRGYIQTFQLRDYILHRPKEIIYDKVICSPLIRTVITAMVSLSTFDDVENRNVINIVPYVKFHDKKFRKINSVSELKEKIRNFKLWFRKTGIHLYQLYCETQTVSPKRINAIHFPRISYTELEDYEHRFRENERIDTAKEFRQYIRQINVSSLLIFTHKRFIMRISRVMKEPVNTSITKMTIGNKDEPTTVTQLYYPSMNNRKFTINRKYEIEQCNNSNSYLHHAKTRKLRVKK
jgi:broad specificity phosphatase PhoE